VNSTRGAAGAGVASLALLALVSFGPANLPRLDELHVDPMALGFALLVAVGSSIVFGLVPSVQASRVDPGAHVRDGARGSSSAALARVRAAFVIGQFGLALTLLVGAGLLVRSFINLRSVEPGFDPEHVVSATLFLPRSRYPGRAALAEFHREMEERLAAVPGARNVGAISNFFLSSLPGMGGITVEGRPDLDERTREFPVVEDAASTDFFRAAGMELVAGRTFTEADGPESTRVAVVNEAFVRIYLADVDPVGRRFLWGAAQGADPPWVTIVGVVRDARRSGLDQPVRPSGFLPMSQSPARRMDVLVRTTSDPLAMVPDVRRAITAIDPQLPLTRVRTLEHAVAEGLAQRSFVMGVLTAFAAAAMALAAIGIFGVMAYLVGQRTREIGIRVALGADRGNVLRHIFAEGMLHAAVGLGLGSLASLGLTRFVRSQLFGLEAIDPTTWALGALILLAAAAVACLIPALRGARVDPMVALREE